LVCDKDAVQNIKTKIMLKLKEDMELQISNYVSMKINYYFTNSHSIKGNTYKDVEDNYAKFTEEIRISDLINQRKTELQKIIDDNDYAKALLVFNNKGLKTIVNQYFKISDFTDRAIDCLKDDSEAQNALKKFFPNEILRNKKVDNV
jgi:hypothetical protein